MSCRIDVGRMALSMQRPLLAHRDICRNCTKAVGIKAKRTSTKIYEYAPLAQHFVFPEPVLHPLPAVLGGLRAVAGAIVGMEAMRGARIDLELSGLVVRCQRRLQRFDGRD